MTASRQCNPTSSGSSLLGRSDPASKDSAGSNPVLSTADVSCSRISHIFSLVPLGDEFNGFVVFMKLFRDFSRLAAGTLLCSWCRVSVDCLDLFCTASHSPPDVRQQVYIVCVGRFQAARCDSAAVVWSVSLQVFVLVKQFIRIRE